MTLLFFPPAMHNIPNAQNTNSEINIDKSRPEDLNIKSFVPTKPLPVPTPSREATLTQKLELALGLYIFFLNSEKHFISENLKKSRPKTRKMR